MWKLFAVYSLFEKGFNASGPNGTIMSRQKLAYWKGGIWG